MELPDLAKVLPVPVDESLEHRIIESEPDKPELGSESQSGKNTDPIPVDSIFNLPGLDRSRIIRQNDKLYIAFTINQKSKKPIRFSINHAGEDKKIEEKIPIRSARVMSPPNSKVSVQDNTMTMTPQRNKRVMMELDIPESQAHTGYEIIEIPLPAKSRRGSKK